MRNFTPILLITATSFFSSRSAAQVSTRYSDVSILLTSDSNSRSVLLSNIVANKGGDQSPFIGAATWSDSSNKWQCRSLLAFDYGTLPWTIRPEQLVRAELLLYPLQVKNETEKLNTNPLKLSVKRVLRPWEDSVTNWLNQPPADSRSEITKQIPVKKKDNTVKINVTELVKDMFQFGNNGFLIGNIDSITQSKWFASARYEDKDLRPALLLTFSVPYVVNNDQGIPPLPLTAKDKRELLDMYVRPEPVVVTPPKEPVKD